MANGSPSVQFGSPPAPLSQEEALRLSKGSNFEKRINKIALAVFLSLASFFLLPGKIALIVSAVLILWALCDNCDGGRGGGSKGYIPPPVSSGPNIVVIQSDLPGYQSPSHQASISILPSSSPILLTPSPGSQPHPSLTPQYGEPPSAYFPVGGNTTSQKINSTFGSVISSSTPPLGTQRHPNDAANDSKTHNSNFPVRGGNFYGFSQTLRSIFPPGTQSFSSSSSDSHFSSSLDSSWSSFSSSESGGGYSPSNGGSSFGPPPGAQRHPGEGGSNSGDYYQVGGGS